MSSGKCHSPKFAANMLDLKWVSRHRGDQDDFIGRHRAQATRYFKKHGADGLQMMAEVLFHRISDERTLKVACDYLADNGGQSPGPDGLTYQDFPSPGSWWLCRDLRDAIRKRKYKLREESVLWIDKGPGRGKRPLVIQSVIDRAVQRACVEIIQPVLDPLFDSLSFGYRPKRQPHHALAAAVRRARKGRQVWVCVDLKDAFSNVPLGRLRGVMKHYLPDKRLLKFLDLILTNHSTTGLRQGGALSPLLLNLYLHHMLDRLWRIQHPKIPLIRYADDILLLCRSEKEAKEAYHALKTLLEPTGMSMKESETEAVIDLEAGQTAEYMGYKISLGPDGLRFRPADGAWAKLEDALLQAQESVYAPIRAFQCIAGWVSQLGPCYAHVHHAGIYDRIRAIASRAGFDEIPSQEQVMKNWQAAHARWKKCLKSS